MSPELSERRLAAILSADVVGYSRLMAADEAETVRTLKAHRELMGGLIRQHAGRVVDAVGDNLLAEFPSVVDAVACAVAVQAELAERNEELPPERRMLLRIGVNLGDVIVDEGRIYGDGVNIAARVQALGQEGGVSISGTAFDQVDGKLGLEFEDLGQHQAKNLPKPVRVYRVRVSEAHEGEASLTVPGFSGRPAIAVLPLDNLSGDPDQEYFADGIAEDLITRLSRWRGFPVIARNSSFVYKGQPVDTKRVSRELGVRYVVEGSVRKAGDRVRISAQLIDATTGHHVWAERYDRELRDVFAVQDEITEAIVSAMHPALMRAETERAIRRDPRSLDAWECFHRGMWELFQGRDSGKARELFERAIELDPQFAAAYSGLAEAYYWDIHSQRTEAPEESTSAGLRAARRAVELDAGDPMAHIAMGHLYSLTGQREEMLTEFECATQLDPSSALAYSGQGLFLALANRPDEAIEKLERAIRLSPRDRRMGQFEYAMAVAHFAAARYEETVVWARRSLQMSGDNASTYRYLAASCAYLGRVEEARAALEAMQRLVPQFSLAAFRRVYAGADPELTERLFNGLRKAGVK